MPGTVSCGLDTSAGGFQQMDISDHEKLDREFPLYDALLAYRGGTLPIPQPAGNRSSERVGVTMKMHRGLWYAALLLAVLLSSGGRTGAGASMPVEEVTVDFDAAEIGRLPAGFSTALTGGGGPVSWAVAEDPTAPGGGKVLAQTSTDATSTRFPLCVYEPLKAKDVRLSVRFKAVSGTVDQAAGIIARFKDRDNYYIVRANALENNVRLYKVVRGQRRQFAGANMKVPAGTWHTLALELRGPHFSISFNGERLFEADDSTFREAGKVGLWTKADSVTFFADLHIVAHDTH